MAGSVAELLQAAIAAQRAQRLDEAIELYDQAIAKGPVPAGVWVNLGGILRRRKRPRAAMVAFARAVEMAPQEWHAHAGLALAQREAGRPQAAARSWRRALALGGPSDVGALTGLATSLRMAGQLEEALDCLDRALALTPNDERLRFDRSLVLLALGRYAEGWAAYESRWQVFADKRRHAGRPAWDGTPFPGRTLLLIAEQGYGDTIQFARFIPWVKAQGGRVLLEVRPALARLLEGMAGVDQLVVRDQDPDALAQVDMVCALGSLPHLAGCTMDTLPGEVPYLPEPGPLLPELRQLLDRAKGRHAIGLAWAGSPTHVNDANRSMELAPLLRLLAVPGVQFFSLQVGSRAEEQKGLLSRSLLLDAGAHLADFADTAALVSRLDLVITVDTALVHLAGALRRPAWVMLPFDHDWRWPRGRADTPWYPTVRQFTQAQQGAWEPVVGRLVEALGAFTRDAPPRSLVSSV